jgi:tRNA (guanine26-N2/guanine27-N2)-dimethyltransferase
MIDSDLVSITEGKTKILIPAISLGSKVATKREPVFFNFAAEFNRDISVIAYSSFLSNSNFGNQDTKNKQKAIRTNITMADSLCGTGARGLRVAVEVPEVNQVYFNDVNPVAIDVAKKSAAINHVEDKCRFSVNEVCKFLLGGIGEITTASTFNNQNEKSRTTSQRFTIVDLDPFGSPANYVDCVMRSVEDGGLISVTATDTAVLCGKYPDVCLRKYYGRPLNNSYTNETALRILISLVALTSARLGICMYPLFAHSNRHYLRLYAKVILSSTLANSVFENIGYLRHCFECGNRTVSRAQNLTQVCELCAGTFATAGWLWTGKIYDKDFVREMNAKTSSSARDGNNKAEADTIVDEIDENIEKNGDESTRYDNDINENIMSKRAPIGNTKLQKMVQRLFSKCMSEHDDIPYYFTSDEIASRLKMAPPSLDTVVENLSKAGFRTSQTGLNPTAFKTEAKINEIMTILRK